MIISSYDTRYKTRFAQSLPPEKSYKRFQNSNLKNSHLQKTPNNKKEYKHYIPAQFYNKNYEHLNNDWNEGVTTVFRFSKKSDKGSQPLHKSEEKLRKIKGTNPFRNSNSGKNINVISEEGVIRETGNYILYEHRDIEKVKSPSPPPLPQPKPKPKPKPPVVKKKIVVIEKPKKEEKEPNYIRTRVVKIKRDNNEKREKDNEEEANYKNHDYVEINENSPYYKKYDEKTYSYKKKKIRKDHKGDEGIIESMTLLTTH